MPRSNIHIVERGKIDTLYWLGTDTSIKKIWAQISPLQYTWLSLSVRLFDHTLPLSFILCWRVFLFEIMSWNDMSMYILYFIPTCQLYR